MNSAAITTVRPRNALAMRVTQRHVARSEWTKLRSLRSTWYTLLITAMATIGFGMIASAATASNWTSMSAGDKATFDPLSTSLLGVDFGVLAIGVLGVLLITGEYSTGMVRSTFAAVPTRLPVLWAKVGVFALVGFAVALPSTLIAFFAGQAFLSSQHIQIAFSHSGVPVAVVGSAVYLMLVGLFGIGLGTILRNTAAGIATFAAIMFVIPPLVGILPASLANAIDPYLPNNAGAAVMDITAQAHTLSPWAGLAVFAGYCAAALAAGAVVLMRRDV
jgi:ABC-type transport system involved in multi-copper enzyme maturation permease subunit